MQNKIIIYSNIFSGSLISEIAIKQDLSSFKIKWNNCLALIRANLQEFRQSDEVCASEANWEPL